MSGVRKSDMDTDNSTDKRIRVLIADNEPIFLRALHKVLGNRGIDVTPVNDGAPAVEKVKTESFDLVVLDRRMPNMDGLAALEAIRHIDPSMPVIMLSGNVDLSRSAEALRKGAVDYLLKPCSIEELVAAIETAYEGKLIDLESKR